ncbi:MAG: DUF1800 domain-containing protein [Yoonia sp.]|uniref:DUF1800 domain-containing protein n=1 Tax=Yoonia sp. TaxID=2212373 RepID=UPI00273FC2A9|nr:DUF1800 domain-containing protein [Yoonia sp.]MDP5086683.1 DUF1800 domain-containing protein [Yoonia sp.]
MATSALAQEAVISNAAVALEDQVIAASVQTETVVFPLQISVTTAGMYVFTSPAHNPVKVTLDGEVIMTAPEVPSDSVEPFKVITMLSAGDHLLELEGVDLTLEQVALVSMHEIGGEPVSVANIAKALTAEEAEVLAASLSNNPAAPANAAMQETQIASLSVQPRQPFVIGGGSADRGTAVSSGDVGGDTAMTNGAGMQMASANPQAARSAGSVSGSVGTSSSGTTEQVASSGGGSVSTGGGSVITPGTVPPPAGTPVAGAPVVPTPTVPPSTVPTPTPTPVVPVVMPADMARASALTPPTNVALTQAVQITGGPSEAGIVSSSGQTLFGQVMQPETFNIVNAVILPSGREVTVDVGQDTGQFAVRLFPEDLITGEATVTVTGASRVNSEVTTVPVSYEFQAAMAGDGISMALSRMTNGPTAELYARVREIGITNYIDEQLNPSAINDAVFNSLNADAFLHTTSNDQGRILSGLFRNNLAHSAFSEKQLQDVMSDFWSNHFFASTKDSDIRQQNVEDRQFFRENAFGDFEDLLLYSARSPLMSQFLDNDRNRANSLNENYGREILELMTVGVNGGYTEEDVIQSARIFTGWNYRRTNSGVDDAPQLFEFEFREGDHDSGDKTFSAQFLNGFVMPGRSGAAGVQEGEEFIALLANDPRTQNYVCGKIVQRFVADVPPANFVQLCVDTWQATNGNSGQILRAILTAPEFITTVELQRNKVKTPYEYAVSVIRALGLSPNLDDTEGSFFERFRQASREGGFDPLEFGLPTGLPETGSAWTSSASMIGKFRAVTETVERSSTHNLDLQTKIEEAGIETAEEVAAYLLTIATADRYSLEEYEQLVAVLKGMDGIFDPRNPDVNETDAFERAAGLLVVLPSFQLQ